MRGGNGYAGPMDTVTLASALAQIDAEIATAERNLEHLRMQRRGAEAFMQRLGIPVPSATALSTEDASPTVTRPPRTASPGRSRAAAGGNTALVTEVLRRAPAEGVSLGETREALAREGYALDADQVRSAVTYLRRKGEAEPVARGRWRLVNMPVVGPSDADSPTVDAVGLSDGLDLTPEGGEHTDGQGSHHDHRVDLGGRNGDRDYLGAP